MSVEIVTAKVKKLVETEVEERRVVITVSEEEAAMLYEMVSLTCGAPLEDLYNDLEKAFGYGRIRGQYAVKDGNGDSPDLHFFKDEEKLR